VKSVSTLTIAVLAGGFCPIIRAQNTKAPIKHVVVIFQENVSFDHYFATYPWAANPAGEPAFNPRNDLLFSQQGALRLRGTPSVNGLSIDGVTGVLLTNNPNSVAPFRLSRSEAVTCDQDHNYTDEQKAFNGGLMNKFVESVGSSSANCEPNVPKSVTDRGTAQVMGYYDGNTVTALWNYAQHYAMSDNSYSTGFGPSTPGAINLISGNTHGATLVNNPDQSDVAGGSVINDGRPAYDDCVPSTLTTISMTGTNVGDLLNAAGVTWGWFQGGFKPQSVTADGTAVCSATHTGLSGEKKLDYIPHHEPFQYYKQTANPHHLPPTSVGVIGRTDQANHQYDISDWWNALNAGNLPGVSYLKAPGYQDGHPGYSNPLDEQTFIVGVVNALMQRPSWNETAIIIAYDDSDGWYDHVMPPIISPSATSADALNGTGICGGTPAASAFQGRCGYGPRQPLLIISPAARENYVDHSITDQSSILRFIEDNWNLGRIGNQSFDAVAGSLWPMFDFDTPRLGNSTLILDPSTGQPQ
jgi:phospholipase C